MKLDTPHNQSPKKDVIYVDIEDDITSIIDKVKQSSSSIVALVPPKRIGVLQSIVNLKLLVRASESANKRLVLITSDAALYALAADIRIPIAKNLQSKPELPEAPREDLGDDTLIEGDATPETPQGVEKPGNEVIIPGAAGVGAAAVGAVSQNDAEDKKAAMSSPATAKAAAGGAVGATTPALKRGGNKNSIPNFDVFRNKMALIVGGGLALVLFLVWALIFAPHAMVTITAKSTPYGVNKTIVASAGGSVDAEQGNVPAIVKDIKKTNSVDFTATGKKEVGEKATGSVTFTANSVDAFAEGATIPAGTTLMSSGGSTFTTNEAVSLPASDSFREWISGRRPSKSVGITASKSGTSSNGASGAVEGAPSGVSATISQPTGGGTDKTITVVSESDAAAARDKLKSQNVQEVKSELKKQFDNDTIVVEESFISEESAPVVSPAVGQEASSAKISIETSYKMVGVSKKDLQSVIDKDLKRQLAGLPNQSIYDHGMGNLRFNDFSHDDNNYQFDVVTTGYIGPLIDSSELAKKLVGKREGEIIQHVKTYEGIQSVDVKFSPFWVYSAPEPDKISIKFQIDNQKQSQ